MQCWYARYVALPPSLRRIVAEVVCTQSTASSASLHATPRRPYVSAAVNYAPGSGSRSFSSTSHKLASPKRLQKGTKPPMRTPLKAAKPAKPVGAKKTTTGKAPAKAPSKVSSKAPPAPKSVVPKTTPKSKDRVSDRRLPGPTTSSNYIRSLSYLPPPITLTPLSEQEPGAPAKAVRIAETPSPLALNKATSLFVRPAPQFLYSAPRFLNLPVNTKMPEICILGRSNVGKSTLLNALAGLETGGQAGHSHGASTGRKGLAITSAKAGCTKMLNGYGFGPPLKPSFAQIFPRIEQEKEEEAERNESLTATPRGAVISRSEKRSKRPGEPTPAYSFVMVDMPGYGFMSRSEWGVEITKYLERRGTLCGAVLLVDSVTGLKDGDKQALNMLRDANVKTTVILTKADKLLPPKVLRPPRTSAIENDESQEEIEDEPPFMTDPESKGEQTLRETCIHVWDILKKTERAGYGAVPWMEGQGWAPEICVTGAGDPKGGGFGVAGARLAICRMAGLITAEQEAKLVKPKDVVKKHPHKGKKMVGAKAFSESPVAQPKGNVVVPFDQIQWSETSTEASLDQTAELRYIADQQAAKDARKERILVMQAEQASRKAQGLGRKPSGFRRSSPPADPIGSAMGEGEESPSRPASPRRSGGRQRAWKRSSSRS